MRTSQTGLLGIILIVGALGCGIFSDAATAVPTPTRLVSIAPTNPPPTRASLAPTAPNAQSVSISESDLNQQLNQNLPPGGQVSNVFLDLHAENTASISATIQLNSITLQPTASLQAAVVNHRIAITVTRVRVGGFGVPSSMIEPQIADLKNMAERELNAQLEKLEQTTGFKLQAITTTENELRLYFAQ